MSAFIQRWLNDELGIPQSDFENDFANGYLFGKVLSKYNQQHDFSSFVDDDKSDTMIHNYTKLHPTMSRLSIPYGMKIVKAIMHKNKGAALNLLYSIRTALSNVGGQVVVGRPTEDNQQRLVNIAPKILKPSAVSAEALMFEKTLRVAAPNQNDLFMEKHMSKFDTDFSELEKQRDRIVQAKLDAHRRRLAQLRQQRLHQLRASHMGLYYQEEQGVMNWQRNQEIRLAQEQAKRHLDARAQDRMQRAKARRQADHAEEVEAGVAEFEQRLENLGISTIPTPAKVTAATVGGNQPSGMQFWNTLEDQVGRTEEQRKRADNMLAEIARRRKTADKQRHVALKRRRAFLAANQARLERSLRQQRSVALTGLLRSQTISESDLQTRSTDIAKHVEVFEANRKHRDELYAERAAQDVEEEQLMQATVYDRAEEQHERDVDYAMNTFRQAEASRVAVHRARATEICQHTMAKLTDLVMTCARQRELMGWAGRGDGQFLPEQRWTELKRTFVSSHSMDTAIRPAVRIQAPEPSEEEGETAVDAAAAGDEAEESFAKPVPVADTAAVILANAGLFGDPEDAASSKSGLGDGRAALTAQPRDSVEPADSLQDRLNFEDYVARRGVWALPPSAEADAPAAVASGDQAEGGAETDALLAPEQLKRAELALGSVIAAVKEMGYPTPPSPPPPDVPQFSTRIALLGAPFSGKSYQARRVAEHFNLCVIDPAELLHKALDLHQATAAEDDEGPAQSTDERGAAVTAYRTILAEFGRAAQGALLQGQTVPNEIYIGLVVACICAMGERRDTKAKQAEQKKAAQAAARKAGAHEFLQAVGRQASSLQVTGAADAEDEAAAAGDDTEAEAGPSPAKVQQASSAVRVAKRDEARKYLHSLGQHSSDSAAAAASQETQSGASMDYGAARGALRNPDGNMFAGWVLDGFPETATQARLLEVALTGFTDPVIPPLTDAERWSQATAPAPEPVPDPNAVVNPFGVQAAIRVVSSTRRLLRRAMGRRLHTKTGIVYHIDSNPPPYSMVDKQALVPVTDADGVPGQLPWTLEGCQTSAVQEQLDLWFHRDQRLQRVRAWKRSTAPVETVRGELDDDDGPGELADRDIHVESDEIGPWAYGRYDALSHDEMYELLQSLIEPHVAPVAVAAEKEEAGGEAMRDEALPTGRSENPQDAQEGGEGAGEGAATAEADSEGGADAKVEDAAGDDVVVEASGDQPQPDDTAADAEAGPEPEPEAAVVDPNAPICAPSISDSDGLHDVARLGKTLYDRWCASIELYGQGLEAQLRGMRYESEASVERLATCRRRFMQYIRRPNHMQAVLSRVQESINRMPMRLREAAEVKNELHLRVEEALSELWDGIDAREADTLSALKKLASDKWVQEQQWAIGARVAALTQLEVDRFTAARQLIIDYYSASAGALVPSFTESEEAAGAAKGKKPAKGAKGKGKGAPAGPSPGALGEKGLPPAVADFEPVDLHVPEADAGAAKGKGKKPAKGAATQDDGSNPLKPVTTAVERAMELVEAASLDIVAQRELRAEREAEREAAEAEGGGGKGKGGKAKGGKGKGKAAGDAPEYTEPFGFLPDECFVVLAYETNRLKEKLAYLTSIGQKMAQKVVEQADQVWADLHRAALERSNAEGAAAEAFGMETHSAIDSARPIHHLLRLVGPYLVVDRQIAAVPESEPPAPRTLERSQELALSAAQSSTLAHALKAASTSCCTVLAPMVVDGVCAGGYEPSGGMPASVVVDVLMRLLAAGKLPNSWSGLQAHPGLLQRFVELYADEANMVDWHSLVVHLMMGRYPSYNSVRTATPPPDDLQEHATTQLTTADVTAAPSALVPPTPDELSLLSETFESLDPDHTGHIAANAVNELRLWFQTAVAEPSEQPAGVVDALPVVDETVAEGDEEAPSTEEAVEDGQGVEDERGLSEEDAAAIRLQSLARQREARKKVEAKRQERAAAAGMDTAVEAPSSESEAKADSHQPAPSSHAQDEQAAAVRLQSLARGRAARQKVARIHTGEEGVVDIQGAGVDDHGDGDFGFHDLEQQQLDEAAVRLQKLARGHLGRRKAQMHSEMEDSIVRIQSAARGTAGRQTVMQLRREKSATKVQALARARRDRRRVEELRTERSATKIQAAMRGRKDRKRVEELRIPPPDYRKAAGKLAVDTKARAEALHRIRNEEEDRESIRVQQELQQSARAVELRLRRALLAVFSDQVGQLEYERLLEVLAADPWPPIGFGRVSRAEQEVGYEVSATEQSVLNSVYDWLAVRMRTNQAADASAEVAEAETETEESSSA